MPNDMPYFIGTNVVDDLLGYLHQSGLTRLLLVADKNTYRVAGQSLEQVLIKNNYTVKTVILDGQEIVADARNILHVLVKASRQDELYIAVGSGTIHDIVRFVSERVGKSFISIPTAPSVDGFPSPGAPLVFDDFKQTIPAQPPAAIFADLNTLCAAPDAMISAGIGDMLGKYTSLADWKLGQILWDEPYSEAIASRTRQAMLLCTEQITAIRQGTADGISLLTSSLVESGMAMVEAGHSRPASGSEHHLSHFWELKLLQRGQPAILHGLKVGLALLEISKLYAKLRMLNLAEVEVRLSRYVLPDAEQEANRIRLAYAGAAPAIIKEQAAFITMTENGIANLKDKITENWPAIQGIISSVPEPETICQWLTQAGIPIHITELNLTENDLNEAVLYAHYLRNRFTSLKLARILGVIE